MNFFQKYKVFLAAIISNDEPKSFKQAMQDERWIEAVKKKIQALDQNESLDFRKATRREMSC